MKMEKRYEAKLILSTYSNQTNNNLLSIETDQKSFLKINLNNGSIHINKIQLEEKSY